MHPSHRDQGAPDTTHGAQRPQLRVQEDTLFEAASVAGGLWWLRTCRMLLPLIMPGGLAGWVMVVTISMRDSVGSLLVRPSSVHVIRPAGALPTENVVELILADHREFEELIRDLRNREEDRPVKLAELADLLVAHAEAEEAVVYPQLQREAPDEADDIAHGEEELADGHVALLALHRALDADRDTFEAALEELSETLTHHLDDEEERAC